MNCKRTHKQLMAKIHGNARENQGFACLATPDPTPPGSSSDRRKAVVGSGLLDRLTPKSAGAKDEEELKNLRIKTKDKVKGNGKTNTVENPPNNLLVMKQVMDAGFSTPFPEGGPFGACYFLNLISGGKPW